MNALKKPAVAAASMLALLLMHHTYSALAASGGAMGGGSFSSGSSSSGSYSSHYSSSSSSYPRRYSRAYSYSNDDDDSEPAKRVEYGPVSKSLLILMLIVAFVIFALLLWYSSTADLTTVVKLQIHPIEWVSPIFSEITIVVAAKGEHKLGAINGSGDLKEALEKLNAIPTSSMLAVEVLWTPQDLNDTIRAGTTSRLPTFDAFR